ncbi:MAG: hypothetical protein ACHQ4F_00115 [Candidatus Dormibacteria bacterium]
MASIRIRWSEQEARKAYARPFMVTFVGDDGVDVGSVALNGADLLYYTGFQTAVLSLAGELFVDAAVEASADPQRAWLDRIAGLMPALGAITITPRSTFDDNQGRVFRLVINAEGGRAAIVDASGLLEYQELQAVLAHQTGGLFRDLAVEEIEDAVARRGAWLNALRLLVQRPEPGEAMNEAWHWA